MIYLKGMLVPMATGRNIGNVTPDIMTPFYYSKIPTFHFWSKYLNNDL